jgi:hypothetical protein
MAKPNKSNKKSTQKNKKMSPVHPHIEYIQNEISTLEEKLVKYYTERLYKKLC